MTQGNKKKLIHPSHINIEIQQTCVKYIQVTISKSTDAAEPFDL